MANETERESRAARRRATYSGSVVRLGEDKPALYQGKSPIERLASQTSLVRRLTALNQEIPARLPREQWPGEVFDIDERNRRLG